MEIGKFKSSRCRLIAWILIPPMLTLGVGLSSYALRLRSEWKLNYTKGLADVLPKVAQTEDAARALLKAFNGAGVGSVQSEDELISFLQEVARKGGFTVDSLKVERSKSTQMSGVPVLTARVKGSGALDDIQNFLGDVSASQQLLSESAVQITRNVSTYKKDSCRAEITFELVLFDVLGSNGGI